LAGYSKTPLSKKLGLRPQDRVVLRDAPPSWSIPAPPDGVSFIAETATSDHNTSAEVVLAFFRTHAQLCDGVPLLAPRIFPNGAIWVAWPRRAGGHKSDIREQHIRDLALPLGLVDVKVAALDEDWSGLRLVWRRELRDTSKRTPG
jgi:Protein of unknown function (DUF3052)